MVTFMYVSEMEFHKSSYKMMSIRLIVSCNIWMHTDPP